MIDVDRIAYVAAIVALQLVLVLGIWGFIMAGTRRFALTVTPTRFCLPVMLAGWLALTVSLVVRSLITGHVPFADQYEFASSFAWGLLLATTIFRLRLNSDIVTVAGSLVALALLVYAFTMPSGYAPLSPVLRQTWLLPAHVSCAVIAYGMFGLAFVFAIMYLAGGKYRIAILPSPAILEKAASESALTGFVFLSLVLVLGSIWANIAWGSYWSWDPKETAALVTWMIYGGYIFARLVLKWKGSRCAWFLVAGFMAVLLTFLGNYFFGGLHSYA